MNREWSFFVDIHPELGKYAQCEARFDKIDYGIRFYGENCELLARAFVHNAPMMDSHQLAEYLWGPGERIRGA